MYEQFMHHNGISTRETPLGTIVLCEFQRLPRLICGKFCWRLVPHQRKRSLPPPPPKKKKAPRKQNRSTMYLAPFATQFSLHTLIIHIHAYTTPRASYRAIRFPSKKLSTLETILMALFVKATKPSKPALPPPVADAGRYCSFISVRRPPLMPPSTAVRENL